MSKELLAQIKKSREFTLQVDKITFRIRRPTDIEAIRISATNPDYCELATQFVIGWSGVTEDDVVRNGGSDEIEFSEELWKEWCSDSPKFWTPIALEIFAQYSTHSKRHEVMEKN